MEVDKSKISRSTPLLTGDKRKLTVGQIYDQYKDVLSVPLPSSGKIKRLDGNNFSFTVGFTATDCDLLESIKTMKIYSMDSSGSTRCVSDFLTSQDILFARSKDDRNFARVRNKKGEDNHQILELWADSRLVKTFNIPDMENHGPINTEQMFKSFVWNPFGDQQLLYVCHKKKLKPKKFYKDEDLTNSSDEYVQEGDWGESFSNIEQTIVAKVSLSNMFKIDTLIMDDFSLANSVWMKDSVVVSVAYPHMTRKLGLIHHNSRPSKIVIHNWAKDIPQLLMTLESDSWSFHSPRINHAGDKFVYLKNDSFGPHWHSVRMHLYEPMGELKDTELIARVDGKRDLFLMQGLPDNCFSKDDKVILFTRADHLSEHLSYFDLETRKLVEMGFPAGNPMILDYADDMILAAGSEVDTSPSVYLSKFDCSRLTAEWHKIDCGRHFDELRHESHVIPTSNKTSFVSALYVEPKLDRIQKDYNCESSERLVGRPEQLPTIVIVHGGPHSLVIARYMPVLVLYASLGLKSVLINYRGSLGVSEDYIRSLSGNVGLLDVDDCLRAMRYFVQNKLVDAEKLIIQGGSHGGFLACHLSCEKEFKFTSAIIRNPVTDIASLHQTTDIPDWAYSVALGHSAFDHRYVPTNEDLVKLYECSPMSRVQQADVPTLMMLGTKDRRVPMFQGQRWVDKLRAQGVETLCKVYSDKHDLGRAEVYADGYITSVVWMLTHLK